MAQVFPSRRSAASISFLSVMKIQTLLAVATLCVLPALAVGQSLPSLASLRVGYTMRKNTVQSEGDLKVQIDGLDREMAEAARLGSPPSFVAWWWRKA